MKLELIKKIEITNTVVSSITIDETTAVFLSYREEDMRYQLLYVSIDECRIIDLDYTEKYYQLESHPVLFVVNSCVGFIRGRKELLLYCPNNNVFETIIISGDAILPQRFNLQWRVPITDCTTLPICFNGDSIGNDTRYVAFLDVDTVNKQAYWKSWISLESVELTNHIEDKYPPKIDTAMLKGNDLYVFTSGGMITSVNKWGMDYYAFVKSNKDGVINKVLLDSGNLQAIDGKKRGVNGILSCSQEYLILTPIFQNDEWKGKQKIFSLVTNEISTITFPRGFGKSAKVIQHYADYFWVYLKDSMEIAICKGEIL